ncbi:MAG: CotH kinase family protein [Myxococcota bacterium]
MTRRALLGLLTGLYMLPGCAAQSDEVPDTLSEQGDIIAADDAIDAADVAEASAESSAESSADASVEDTATLVADSSQVEGPSNRPPATHNCVTWLDDAEDPSAALFDPECVLDVRIEMSPVDWRMLRNQTRPLADIVQGDCLDSPPSEVFDWFEAEISVSGREVSTVGLRKKGFLGSLSEEKPSLKVRFDKYVDDQSLAGLTRLTLNNMIQDPGLVNACLGYAVMSQAGVPAPRCNFARVQVNGEVLGLYAHVDSIKKPFIARHFESDEGNLYEATISDFRTEFRRTWEKKTHTAEDDWSDLDAAVAALELPDDELMPALSVIFDLDAFYTFWAAEVLVAHWDGYAGNRNNTYIYADPSDGRFRFIPWGLDSAFVDPALFIGLDGELPDSVYAFGHLASRLYAHPEGKAAYVARLLELLDTAWDVDALTAELDRMEDMLSEYLSEEEAQELTVQISAKRSWVTYRENRIRTELILGGEAWTYPPAESICWTEGGTLSATFDTRWGTSGGDFFDQPGSVNHDVTTLEFIGNVASNARLGAGPTEGQAVIELIGNNTQGEYFIVYIFGPLELFTPGTTQPLDWSVFSGLVGRIEIFEFEFEPVALLVEGVISFEEASTYLGETVKGSLEATVIQPP